MAKVTKIVIKEFVKSKLSKDPRWTKQALLKIYEFQTEEEKEIGNTRQLNGVGFTGSDGDILSSFAQQLIKKGYLSPKQMIFLFKKMPKYWKQIISISDEKRLLNMIKA